MTVRTKLQNFFQARLALILGIYIILQPVLDVLTSLGAAAEHPVTAGVLVRTIFMVLTFLYVLFVSEFKEKKWCLAVLGVLIVYLLLFMLHMFSLGGLSLCLANVKELVKVFFAPFVLVFLYTVYRQYGYLIPSRAVAWAGGIYAGIILLAYLTGTSNVSYGNSGYGYNGWFYAANEVSCIIAITAPITIWYCLKQLPTVTRKTWWKGALIVLALISVAFSATAIGTKIVFGVTLMYCLVSFIWSLVRYSRQRDRETALRAIVLGLLFALTFGLYFSSSFQSYFNDIFLKLLDNDPELTLASWGQEIQEASEGTWLRELLNNNEFLQRLDQILSRRLLSSSPSIQVYTEGGLAAKLLGIGYADVPSYGRSIEFMIEMDPLGILIRQGILGFLVYYVPYLVAIIYVIIQFFQRAAQRLSSLKYCSYLYSTLAAFAISAIAGHALVSPAVSTFVLIISFRLLIMTRDQNRERLSR